VRPPPVFLARAAASLLGGDTRPVFAAAGILTLCCSAAAWLTGLRRKDSSQLTAALLAR
jgi:hypothetical protein